MAEILEAATAMHRAFHLERQYVTANLCPCTGCKGAADLKLKFVAHIGDVATQTIRERIKLVGIDVILVHRLLKNPVGIPEYVLVSEELYRIGEDALPDPVHEVSPELEGFGTVHAYFVDVEDLDGSHPAAPRAVVAGSPRQDVRGGGQGPAVHGRPSKLPPCGIRSIGTAEEGVTRRAAQPSANSEPTLSAVEVACAAP